MHLEAYAIDSNAKDGESVEQRVLCSDADRALGLIVGDGGFPVTTTMIGGREYVLIATPFGN